MELQGKNILIKPEDITMTTGGIHLSPQSKKAPIGMVVDTGPGCDQVKTGDRVYYKSKRAHRIQIEAVEHHFLSEDDILYVH